ncbi:MAG: asparaginase domain-containing protein [Synergistaceae bacterium]|nr:asparaginase domain-containing protein [Synergistaceae bacterium]
MPNRNKTALILAGGQIVIEQASAENEVTPLEEEKVLACLTEGMRERVFTVDWSSQPLCHYTLRMCSDLVQLAGRQVEEGAAGVVITCGTQALTELAYFADLVWSYPQPLIFTASINYAGTPGSETALHLSQSVRAAESRVSWGQGALVCLQDAIYAAAELSCISNYTRSGYAALSGGPIAEFLEPCGELAACRSLRRGKVLNIDTSPARSVEILDASLGGGDILLNALLEGRASELDGLVLSAFGGGDIPPSWVPLLRKIMRSEIPVVLTSRCLSGRVQPGPDFEGAAKHLLEMGLMSAGVLTPLKARIRLAVGLGAELSGQSLRDYMLDK